MKILQLCKKYPFPARDGESLAVMGLSRALCDLGCELHLLTMNTAKHFYPATEPPPELGHYASVSAVPVDNRIRWWGALQNLFSGDSYHVSRYVSGAFRSSLIRILQAEDFDIVQLETPFLSVYIPEIRRHSQAKVVMRAHNVEHEIWKLLAKNFSLPPIKWYLRLQSNRLRAFEIACLKDYDLLLPITREDEKRFRSLGYRGSIQLAPAGIRAENYPPEFGGFGEGELQIGFIGSLDWIPNLEGLDWFLREIWPGLLSVMPNLRLRVAGRNMPKEMKRRKVPGVEFLGEVPSAKSFINQHPILIAPLLAGSGMRIKVLEGMALGKVVITTSIGLEGIPARHGEEVFLADSPEDFQQVLLDCSRHPEKMEKVGRQARKLVLQTFDQERIGKDLKKAYHRILHPANQKVARAL